MNRKKGQGKGTREERQARLERLQARLELPMAVLALVWVGAFVVTLVRPFSPFWQDRAEDLVLVIWFLFLLQFLVELWLAPDKLHYLRHNWLVGLSVFVPFLRIARLFLALGALRSIVLVNLLSGAGRTAQKARAVTGRQVALYVTLIVVISVLLGSAGVYLFERNDPASELRAYPAALWWAATMITTINTNTDPVTLEGRIVGILLRVIGLSLFSYLTATVATFLIGRNVAVEAPEEEGEKPDTGGDADLEEIRRQLAELRETVERWVDRPEKGQ